ncbi:MAG: OmpA family protein, partial [Thiomargarita sp.]|nr:OmpA family protein [Thiomargarita sp.]
EELEKGVDANGCPIDSDQDGVPDYRDSCLNNTKIELAKGVDSTGCPLDSDQDGVPDYLDACPNNSKSDLENEVDASGCVVVTAVIVPEESTYTVQTNSEGALVTFNGDVLFASDSSQLKVDAQTSIEKLIKSLNIDDIQQITVVGHTDHFGSKLYNQKLSEKRAKSVARFLLKKGVSADKVSTEGKGEEQPLSNKKTKTAYAENRRVELKITGFKITEE